MFKRLKDWRDLAAVLVISAVMFGLTACGDNPDYSAGTSSTTVEGTYTFKVSIGSSSDISIVGSSGGSVDIIGAPITGEEVSVVFASTSSSGTETPAIPETPAETPSAPVGLGGSGGVGCSLIR